MNNSLPTFQHLSSFNKQYADLCLMCGNVIDLKLYDVHTCCELNCNVPHCVKCSLFVHSSCDMFETAQKFPN